MAKSHSTIPESKRTRIGAWAPKRPVSKKEEQEFGPGKENVIMCSECKAVYYLKSWHESLEGAVKGQTPEEFAKYNIDFEICPACQMKKDKVFEGEVVIKLGKPAEAEKQDILNAVWNADELARERDPMDRILWIDDQDSEIRVYTSENQLAVKIGKKLDSAFKGGRLEIKYSEVEDTARVVWEKFN